MELFFVLAELATTDGLRGALAIKASYNSSFPLGLKEKNQEIRRKICGSIDFAIIPVCQSFGDIYFQSGNYSSKSNYVSCYI